PAPNLVPPARTGHPPVTRQVLPNGLVVLVYPDHSNPDVSISGAIRAGALADPPGKQGLANFVADMLDRGAGNRTEDEISSALDFVGASASVSASGSGTFFTGHSLVENWPLTLGILADEIQKPTFPSAIVDRTRNQLETEIQVAADDPETVAMNNFFATLYPADYPLHWPILGVADTVKNITRDDLVAFHDRYYRPDLTTIVVVGDVQPDAAVATVQQYFGSWAANGSIPNTEPPVMEDQIPAQQVNKTMPGKSEEIAVMGFRGITRKDPDYYPAYLMNLILGNGDFNSRFMKDIRDRKGLVYGVSSAFEAGLVAGPWILEMQSSPTNADRAIRSATIDMRQMQLNGPTPAEMRLFKGWVSGSQALRLETSAGIAESLLQSEYYGLGIDYTWTYPELINAVTREQALAAARRFLHPDNLITSTAGPS
ncbi:MAG TPA: pitrilysin family protein, partial [Armatimonadota bacterium]|nr:pitrilysin family protein [Armatimonadota bacterium]